MSARIETQRSEVTTVPLDARRVSYALIAGVAALTSVGIWVLMVLDEERSVGAATLEMVVKFTNLTVVLISVVAGWIAIGRAPGPVRQIAHLMVIVMAAVTAMVNATLLDPALPSGWWGVVDLFQHYVIPAAVVIAWAMLGPPVDVPPSRIVWIVAVPLAWLVVVLARGAATGNYPYDFIDVAENGWVSVIATVGALLGVMLAAGLGLAAIDRRRQADRAAR
jgi:hypothetical protein